jgi:hypothetical protein
MCGLCVPFHFTMTLLAARASIYNPLHRLQISSTPFSHFEFQQSQINQHPQ